MWVFLSLSGWLIGAILLRTDRKDLPRFYYNRALRIWIPFFAAVAMLYAVAAVKDGIDANWWKYLFYDLSFTHYNFTVFPQALSEMPMDGTGNNYWSISVEEQFYLIAPFLLSYTALVPQLAGAAAFVLAVVFVGVAFLPIAGGVLAAMAQKRFGDWHQTKPGRIAVWGAMLISFAIVWVTGSILVLSFFSVTVVLALSGPGQRNPVALFFGAISFPLYLNAWIGIFAANIVARRLTLEPTLTTALQFVLSVLAATVCWYLIDRPVRARREAWFRWSRGRIAAIAAYVTVAIGWIGGLILIGVAA